MSSQERAREPTGDRELSSAMAARVRDLGIELDRELFAAPAERLKRGYAIGDPITGLAQQRIANVEQNSLRTSRSHG